MSYYIGLMSGTSADAIDAALVLIENDKVELVATHSNPISGTLREKIVSLYAHSPAIDQIDRLGELDTELGQVFGRTAAELLSASNLQASDVRAIGCHGQTVRHRPRTASGHHFTLQITDANIVAEVTGITTVTDFRRRDMACGGQGAPLAPAFHKAVFASKDETRAVINLGGVANITLLPSSGNCIGFDTGPSNGLMDAWAQKQLGQPYDAHGSWAANGTLNTALLSALKSHPYFALPAPKSSGREEFSLNWLEQVLASYPSISTVDVQATLAHFTAETVADSLLGIAPTSPIEKIFLCGGGVKNDFLVSLLKRQLPGTRIDSTSQLGIDPDWVEACAFGWLAHRTMAGLSGNEPSVTGANKQTVLGCIYPA